MPGRTCRICGRELAAQPLLRYRNMPRAAQHLPAADEVAAETGVDLNVCQCDGCAVVQIDCEPVPYYREVIRAAVSDEMMQFRRAQFAAFVGRFTLTGRKVIEIGCGCGEYLALLKQCGVRAFGVEQSAASVADCARRGLDVTQDFVGSRDHALLGRPFDAFLMLNFLEHLPDPNSTLAGIAGNLAANAVGLVEVPNFDMILRRRLFTEFCRDHLLYFTADTLGATLSRNGFDVLDCSPVWHDYILSATVRKRPPLDLSGFRAQQERLQREIGAYLSRFAAGRVAVWGAGHQALAVLALASLAGRVRYVVDSAPFKQGRFTPATHLPIVPPDTLRTDPVDAVIVMAGSYSDEVARLLRTTYDVTIGVAILREDGLDVPEGPVGP